MKLTPKHCFLISPGGEEYDLLIIIHQIGALVMRHQGIALPEFIEQIFQKNKFDTAIQLLEEAGFEVIVQDISG